MEAVVENQKKEESACDRKFCPLIKDFCREDCILYRDGCLLRAMIETEIASQEDAKNAIFALQEELFKEFDMR